MSPVLWLLKDFELLSVLLHGLAIAWEALTLGGLAFCLIVEQPARSSLGLPPHVRARRVVSWAALGFALAQLAATGITVATLVSGSGLAIAQVLRQPFLLEALAGMAFALILAAAVRLPRAWASWVAGVSGAGLLAAVVAGSHAASRMDGRLWLSALTALHHLGMAAWVGAMFFLLLALRRADLAGDHTLALRLARRYSALAMAGVALLVGAGIGLSYAYIGSWNGLYGSSYGILVMAKSYLVLTMLLLGASNQRLIRSAGAASGERFSTLRLRRFSEVELGLGFTAMLAAASLTAQAPAIDLQPGDRLTGHEIVERLRWQAPRLTSPPLAALAPPTTLEAALPDQQFGSGTVNDANDRAWSEYNHHWAGLIVLAAGLLAFAGRALPAASGRLVQLRSLAGGWPLLFLGLAVFILLRADPENWPLGPRPFWASFSRPDVLEHRLYAALITAFTLFEWAVERRSLRSPRAAYVFPLVCAAGGAALLTHAHALGSMHQETLAELSHTPIALMGATAGWGRWLELRLPGSRAARLAGRVWPICLALVGLLLLDYREA